MQFKRPLGPFAILYRTEEVQKPSIFEMPNFRAMSREDANRVRMRDWYWAKKAGFKHLADYYRDKVETSLAAHGKVKWE